MNYYSIYDNDIKPKLIEKNIIKICSDFVKSENKEPECIKICKNISKSLLYQIIDLIKEYYFIIILIVLFIILLYIRYIEVNKRKNKINNLLYQLS